MKRQKLKDILRKFNREMKKKGNEPLKPSEILFIKKVMKGGKYG